MAPPAPMLASSGREWPAGDAWVLEPKWDGFRMLAAVGAGRARAWTRHGTEVTSRVSDLLAELAESLPDDSLVDGELVALAAGSDGRIGQDFARVGRTVFGGDRYPLCFVIFDAPRLHGKERSNLPWQERRAALEVVVSPVGRHVSLVDVLDAKPEVHERLVALGFEGSVLKHCDARYLPGRRSPSWRKMKTRSRSAAVLEVVVPDRGSGVVERVGCRVADHPERLTWAVVWGHGLRSELTGDPIGAVGREVEVAYTHRTITGALREARVTSGARGTQRPGRRREATSP